MVDGKMDMEFGRQVVTEVDNEFGDCRYYVEFFPKSRQGLNDAYKYALTQPNWTIFFNMEEVDNSDDFDINQVDEDTVCI